MELTSYFQLELDTTPPVLEIFSPNTASSSTKTRVRIQSNEELMNWQDIYAVYGDGNREDLTFSYYKDYFEADIRFRYDSQIITIFAQLKDTVGNLSSVVTRAIRLLNGNPLVLTTSEQSREIIETITHKELELDDVVRVIFEEILINDHQISDSEREVKDDLIDLKGRDPYYDRTRGQP